MKSVFVILALLIANLAIAQTYTTKWSELITDTEDGVRYEIDTNSISLQGTNFSVMTRAIFFKPQLMEDGKVVLMMLMLNEGNCTTRHTRIVRDAFFNSEGVVAQNHLSKADKFSVPADGSVHSMLLNALCPRGQNV